MTIVQHGFLGVLIAYEATHNPVAVAVACVLSMVPDLGRLFSKDWSVYNKMHSLKWYWLILPFYNLHILVDYPLHYQDEIGGWKPYTVYVEVLFWVLEIAYILWRLGII